MQQQFHELQEETTAIPSRSGSEQAAERTDASVLAHVEQRTEVLPAAIQQSSRQVRKWRQRKRRIIGASVVLFPVSLALVALSVIVLPTYQYLLPYLDSTALHILNTLFVAVCITVPASLIGVIIGILMRPMRQDALTTLCEADDVHVIGALLDASEMLMPDVKLQAVAALIPLLARIRAEDDVDLNRSQRSRLRRLLNATPIAQPDYQALEKEGIPTARIGTMRAEHEQRMDEQRRFALAALHALKEIGTGRDAAVVQRIANGEALGYKDPLVQEAAKECLPILLARAEEERSSNTYLRASQRPTAHAEVLLRAATAATETSPQHLLRATDSEPK